MSANASINDNRLVREKIIMTPAAILAIKLFLYWPEWIKTEIAKGDKLTYLILLAARSIPELGQA